MANPSMVIRVAANIEELKKNLAEGKNHIETTTAAMGKIVASLQGDKLIQHAMNVSAAVNQIGGASKLTEAEMARVHATVSKALEKYQALGREAPPGMQALADATKKVDQNAGAASKSFDVLGIGVGKLFAAFSAASLVDRAVGTLTNMAHEALATAGTLVDLSNKTGLSTDTIQRMQFVAKQSGTDMSVFSDAAFKMGVNVSEGTKKAREGAEILGLSWKDLRAASPDAQFDMVVQALEAMEDPHKRNQAAVALFGKTAKEILPAIVDGYTKIAKEAHVAGDAQVKAVDAMGDAWDRWKARMTSSFVNAAGSVILLREAVATLTQDQRTFILQTDKSIKTTDDFSAALIRAYQARLKAKDVPLPSEVKPLVSPSFVTDLKAAEVGYRALTAAQLADLQAALKLGASNDDIINQLNITEGVLAVGKKAFEDHKSAMSKAAEAAKKSAEAWQELNAAGVDYKETYANIPTQIRGLTTDYLKAGASVDAVATALKLEKIQVEAVQKTIEQHKKELVSIAEMHNKVELAVVGLKGELGALNNTEEVAVKKSIALYESLQHLRLIENVAAGFDDATSALGNLGRKSTELDQLNIKLAEVAQTVEGRLRATLNQIPTLLTQAFTGGGGVLGAAKAIGTQLANDIMGPLLKQLDMIKGGKAAGTAAGIGAAGTAVLGSATGLNGTTTAVLGMGTALAGTAIAAHAASAGVMGLAAGSMGASIAAGALTMGIGTAAIGAVLLAKHFFTVSKAEKDARTEFEAYQKQFGTLDDMIAKVGAAYALTGRTGAQAEAALKVALDATHHSARDVHAALETINAVMVEAQKKSEALLVVDDRMKGLLETIDTVGIGLPTAFRPMIDDLLAMPGLTDSAKGALQGLLDNASPNFARLESMAKSYGGEIDKLGPAFQQAHVTADASKWINDFESLKAAGADMNGVLGFMADEASAVVQESLKFGAEIPENMKPMIQSLIDSGQLLDENKNQITDISGLKFGAAVKTDVDKLKDAIEKLAEAIGKIPNAIAALPTSIDIGVHGKYFPPDIPGQDTYGGPIAQASGGDWMVTRPTMFLAGERGPERATFSPQGGASRGGGGGTVVIEVDRRWLAEILVPELPGAVERYGLGR